MEMRGDLIDKLKVFSLGVAAIFGMAIIFLYFGLSTRTLFPVAFLYILLICVIAIVVSLNLIYFYFKMSKAHPGVARALPTCFALALMFYFWAHQFLFGRAFHFRSVLIFSLLSLASWLVLNVGVYLVLGRSSKAPWQKQHSA